MTIIVLLAALAALGIAFTVVFVSTAVKRGETRTSTEAVALGAITNFFDTLGIGSFAPSTAWIKFRHLVPDSFIPAILNVGHSLPTIAQSAIFLVILGVNVDPMLLASCIVAAVIGALIGAPLVVRAPVRLVQGIVGVALLIAAGLYAMSNLNLMPIGGSATALPAMVVRTAVRWPAAGAAICLGTALLVASVYISVKLAVAAGVRRIEALTGAGALAYLNEQQRLVREASLALRTPPAELPERISRLLDERTGRAREHVRRAIADRARRRAWPASPPPGTSPGSA